jgi:hypothetical protein
MRPVIAKTFGGLSFPYYIRNFLMGLLPFAFIGAASLQHGFSANAAAMLIFAAVNTFLYPYSKFALDSVLGDALYRVADFFAWVNVAFDFLRIVAFIFMFAFGWGFAIFIAPFSLIYLYFYHSRNAG